MLIKHGVVIAASSFKILEYQLVIQINPTIYIAISYQYYIFKNINS